MLEMRNVSKAFAGPGGAVRALQRVSLDVAAGEFVAVRGPSGSGKSTLLMVCGGLLESDEGRVVVDGEDLYAMSPNRRATLRAERIGFVFQRFHLVPYLNVRENVLVASMGRAEEPQIHTDGHGLRGRGRGERGAHGQDARATDARDAVLERARGLLERLGMSERAEHFPAQLSTGERQRVALARAMLNGPKLLLADEPTGNLDPENGRVVLECLAEFAAGGGAVLLVTHDSAAAEFAGRTMLLQKGEVLEAADRAFQP